MQPSSTASIFFFELFLYGMREWQQKTPKGFLFVFQSLEKFTQSMNSGHTVC